MKILILAHSEPQIRVFLQNCLLRLPGGSSYRIHRIKDPTDLQGRCGDVIYALPRWTEVMKYPFELDEAIHRRDFRLVRVTEEQLRGEKPFELVPYEFITTSESCPYKVHPEDAKKMLREAKAISSIVQRGLDLRAPDEMIILELAKENKRLTDALVALQHRGRHIPIGCIR